MSVRLRTWRTRLSARIICVGGVPKSWRSWRKPTPGYRRRDWTHVSPSSGARRGPWPEVVRYETAEKELATAREQLAEVRGATVAFEKEKDQWWELYGRQPGANARVLATARSETDTHSGLGFLALTFAFPFLASDRQTLMAGQISGPDGMALAEEEKERVARQRLNSAGYTLLMPLSHYGVASATKGVVTAGARIAAGKTVVDSPRSLLLRGASEIRQEIVEETGEAGWDAITLLESPNVPLAATYAAGFGTLQTFSRYGGRPYLSAEAPPPAAQVLQEGTTRGEGPAAFDTLNVEEKREFAPVSGRTVTLEPGRYTADVRQVEFPRQGLPGRVFDRNAVLVPGVDDIPDRLYVDWGPGGAKLVVEIPPDGVPPPPIRADTGGVMVPVEQPVLMGVAIEGDRRSAVEGREGTAAIEGGGTIALPGAEQYGGQVIDMDDFLGPGPVSDPSPEWSMPEYEVDQGYQDGGLTTETETHRGTRVATQTRTAEPLIPDSGPLIPPLAPEFEPEPISPDLEPLIPPPAPEVQPETITEVGAETDPASGVDTDIDPADPTVEGETTPDSSGYGGQTTDADTGVEAVEQTEIVPVQSDSPSVYGEPVYEPVPDESQGQPSESPGTVTPTVPDLEQDTDLDDPSQLPDEETTTDLSDEGGDGPGERVRHGRPDHHPDPNGYRHADRDTDGYSDRDSY